ncbi:hypothetical protein CK203_099359 [Vitis vinifera]|uniref:Retrotransposon gag domain-containing protein n=1 Tax=Vitis vinifera TaxID=29760 RepID=A0A438CHQ3_VITVI|nr:hypothetical protein CK203_099359 [Vitis vinifera]
MRLNLFPFTLKDKAKIWLNSLRSRSIQTWTDLQAEFLKKFFLTHRTNGLKKKISNFSAKENEKFYECWERYMEAINACPHHDFDTWLLVSYFYDSMSSSMKQLLETMCGDFMSKNPEEAMDFLRYVAEEDGMNPTLESYAKEIGRARNERYKKCQPFLRHQYKLCLVPFGIHEVAAQEGESSKVREVKAVVTLRSGKEVDQPTSKPKHDEDSVAEKEKSEEIKGKRKGKNTKKYDHDSSVDEEPERIVIKEDMMKKHMPPPFPQALHGKKGTYIASEIFEVLRQVKANIPLLDMIKQVPTYAKFLKDLCTVKRGLNVNKKAFLTEQVSAIIQCKSPVNVNLLPYYVYKQLELGELKPTSITLSLADRSLKIPRWMIEDVLVQVNKFYYPMDFVVLDTDPVIKGTNYVPIILGRPFLATSNSIINCRNGVMQLTFGNMTLELNIFHLCKKHIHPEKKKGYLNPQICLLPCFLGRGEKKFYPYSMRRRHKELLRGAPNAYS